MRFPRLGEGWARLEQEFYYCILCDNGVISPNALHARPEAPAEGGFRECALLAAYGLSPFLLISTVFTTATAAIHAHAISSIVCENLRKRKLLTSRSCP
jgi:hypothetical protein